MKFLLTMKPTPLILLFIGAGLIPGLTGTLTGRFVVAYTGLILEVSLLALYLYSLWIHLRRAAVTSGLPRVLSPLLPAVCLLYTVGYTVMFCWDQEHGEDVHLSFHFASMACMGVVLWKLYGYFLMVEEGRRIGAGELRTRLLTLCKNRMTRQSLSLWHIQKRVNALFSKKEGDGS
ncbi:hypothetical protein ACP26L_14120 [Paenibacillus sp. S-38]|uniref:hypothetical protein n=1 Tax=Paenibacillus sp. S-38 TaxID=3416710 RepID=UPI003CF44D29